jgi:hypothetical protein
MSDEHAVCAHLRPAEAALREAGFGETYRGQPWTDRCRNWVYYDRIVPVDDLLARQLYDPNIVTVHRNLDQRSGTEMGLYCTLHHDGLMGPLPTPEDYQARP